MTTTAEHTAVFHSLCDKEGPPWILWAAPEGELLFAAGAQTVYQPSSSDEWRRWLRSLRAKTSESLLFFILAFEPAAKGGAEWKDVPRVWAFEPQKLYRSWAADNTAAVQYKAMAANFGDAEDDQYLSLVRSGIQVLQNDELDKIVLARRLQKPTDIDSDTLITRLMNAQGSFRILFSPDGRKRFVSLTPERLVQVRQGIARTVALAGTIPRSTDEATNTIARSLLETNLKEKEEHDYVVQMIGDALQKVSDAVHTGAREIIELPHLYHLKTDITARLYDDVTLAAVVSLLHPTPAVAGMPRDVAMSIIAGSESFDRGLFAGAIGWMDSSGDGDAAVTIRSALLDDGVATAYAGAGIMRDSDPASELLETTIKMQTVLNLLFQ